jgi:hypothetical protein
MKNSRLAALILFVLVASAASARPDLCETAIGPAARAAGVPADVLLAISLTETGRVQNGQLRPWPWAANGGGAGHWFATRDEALAFADRMLARGDPSFDLGCFQINWRWHRTAFSTPADLLHPPTAARYAADLLARLFRELDTWEAAAGAYHSRTPALAARYRDRFANILATLVGQSLPQVARLPSDRDSGFPLFFGTASGASLVPAALPPARPLFERHP